MKINHNSLAIITTIKDIVVSFSNRRVIVADTYCFVNTSDFNDFDIIVIMFVDNIIIVDFVIIVSFTNFDISYFIIVIFSFT